MSIKVEESILVDAKPDKIFDLLWDVKTYPKIFPQIKKASEKKKGAKKEAMFEAELLGNISYTLLMEADKPKQISWTLVKGDMMKSNIGAWILNEKKGKTNVTYKMEVELSIWVPGSIAQNLLSKHLPTVLSKIKEKIENEK